MTSSKTTPLTRLSTRTRAGTVAVALLVATVGSACGVSGGTGASNGAQPRNKLPIGPSCIPIQDAPGCLPVAPPEARVDLNSPIFSNPTSVTNTLHPSSKIEQVIYGGQVDEKPFRTEFTLLPDVKTIAWNGLQVKAITWQYLAYLDGRIEEIAVDWFAQADDGSVWYLGEDVADFRDGVIYTNEGTWLAGKDGPAAMIMPAGPKVGDVFRTENAPGIAFEEMTVKSVDQTVPGPYGPVSGAMIVSELHADGTTEDKTFAPGYGEFSTGSPSGDLEAVSLAAPTDVAPGSAPPSLVALSKAVRMAYDAVGANDWAVAAATTEQVRTTWDACRAEGMPDILDKQMTRDIDSLLEAVGAAQGPQAHQAALRVAQNDTDLHVRYRPVVEVDATRLDLWTRQLPIDVADEQVGSVLGDVATLELIRDRMRHALEPGNAAGLDTALQGVRAAAEAKDLVAVSKATDALEAAVAAIQPA